MEHYTSILEDIQIRILTYKQINLIQPILWQKSLRYPHDSPLSASKVEQFFNSIYNDIGSVFSDSNIICKTFISNDELTELRLNLIKSLLNLHENSAIGEMVCIEIKKFFYVNLFFRNKITVNPKILSFSIENYDLLSKLATIPFSPGKQRHLYQSHFKELSTKDSSIIPDLELPLIKSKLESLKPASNSLNQTQTFCFSSDWPSEMFKVVLESVFAKRVDELDTNTFGLNLISVFLQKFSVSSYTLSNQSLGILFSKIEARIENTEEFENILVNISYITQIFIKYPNFLKLISDKQTLIENNLFAPVEDEEKEDELTSVIKSPKQKLIQTSVDNIKLKSNSNDYKLTAKESYKLNWRAICSYIKSKINLAEANKDDVKLIEHLNDIYIKLGSNHNYQVQKEYCQAMVNLYKLCPKIIKNEMIDRVITILAKSKNFYVRRYFIVFCELFLSAYSFVLFRQTTLYSTLIKKLRDQHLLPNVVNLLWRIYPFIESNLELKKELDVQLDFVKANYSRENSTKCKANCIHICGLIERIETIYSFDVKAIVAADSRKYDSQAFEFSYLESLNRGSNLTTPISNKVSSNELKLPPPIIKFSEKNLTSKKIYKLSGMNSSIGSSSISLANLSNTKSGSSTNVVKPSKLALPSRRDSGVRLTSSMKSTQTILNPIKLNSSALRRNSLQN